VFRFSRRAQRCTLPYFFSAACRGLAIGAGQGGPMNATSLIDTILDRSVVLGYGNTGWRSAGGFPAGLLTQTANEQ
jgi:hypothetical protein